MRTRLDSDLKSGGPPAPVALEVGERLADRFEILEELGRGGFGAVYRARDAELDRIVAVKRATVLRSFVAGQVRGEARAIASLNHPNIISIYDLISLGDDELLIVMECPEGTTLAHRLQSQPISIEDAVKISVQIAEGLRHAHSRQLVHSDLKPANVLVADDGRIWLLDFGLAVARFPDPETQKATGGTPGYMSPEQARGESHLIDGRADLWALGVVLYQMLTGNRPFTGQSATAIFKATVQNDPPPIRQLRPDVDVELQRIVSKCLEKRKSDRYASADDLIEDLRAWQGEPSQQGEPASKSTAALALSIATPPSPRLRGLQPYTEDDSDSYLTLVPGPRDRHGVPESIQFWRRWVESDDPEFNSPVGVLYGPSGSGKTSFVRAGLMRQIDRSVCPIYIECRSGDLGGRITRLIQSRIQERTESSSLQEILTRIRTGDSSHRSFRKMLLILDQFETWAQRARLQERRDFAEALRQCDGAQIRALVVTRDDFWMGVTELLRWLEIPLQEGRNMASVGLLDRQHAASVLEQIGRSSGALAESPEPITDQQQQFITQAVDELAVGDSVIAVHLVMFSQMAGVREWSPRQLRDSGGVIGSCSLFLQESFSGRETSRARSPVHRRVAPAAIVVLSALLPEDDAAVADWAKTEDELRAEAAQNRCGHLLDDCLQVLADDMRIITVVDKENSDSGDSEDSPPRFRLSHGFLVQPIREWIDRAKKRTWRGRKLARLEELAGIWKRRPDLAQMPGFLEYFSLMTASNLGRCSDQEKAYIKAATRHHSGRISIAVVSLIAFLGMTVLMVHQRTEARAARARELAAQVRLLMTVPPEDVGQRIEALTKFSGEAVNVVSTWAESDDPDTRLRALLFLYEQSSSSFQELGPLIEDASPEFFRAIARFARTSTDGTSVLTQIVEGNASTKTRDRAAILLHYLGDSTYVQERLSGSDDYDRDGAFLTECATWRDEPQPWIELLADGSSPQVQYHVLVVLSTYPADQLNVSDFDFDALCNSSDAAVHSASRAMMSHLGLDPYSIELNPPADANWIVGPADMPMVRIEADRLDYVQEPNAPNDTVLVEIARPLWVSTMPVSRELYDTFRRDAKVRVDGTEIRDPYVNRALPEHLKSDLRQPVLHIDQSVAMEFCNWLSRRENRTPCYQHAPVEGDETKSPLSEWKIDFSADGYRLPNPAEFTYLARCGYRNGLAWSNAKTFARLGGDFVEPKAYAHAQAVMSTMPNRLALFINDTKIGTWLSDKYRGGSRVGTVGVLYSRDRDTSSYFSILVARTVAND